MKDILETHPVANLKKILKEMKQQIGSYSKMKKAELVARIIELKMKGFPVPKVEIYKKPVTKKAEPKPKPQTKKPEAKPKPVTKKPEAKPKPVTKKAEPKPKPVTKKPEPKKPPAKPKIELNEVKGDIDFEDLFNELAKGFQSRRNIQNFKKKFGKDFFTTTLDARLRRDFYSTPPKCILENDIITKALRGSSDIFEPTAGLGALVYSALRSGASRQNITANDIIPEFADFIKKNFKVKTTNNDFLKTDYKNNKFDTILMNPPFSFAGNKKFYMDFFYKGVKVLQESKAKGIKQMFFISPSMGEEKNGLLLEENFNINDKKKIELYKKYGLEDDIIDGEPESVASQINVIGKCKDFGGTGIIAVIYEVLV